MSRPPKARDKVLVAYCELLHEGERSATLEAIAARAGVSKGGLLYHFSSKEELGEALLARFDEALKDDLEEMAAAPQGPSRHYVRTSWTVGSDLDLVYGAVYRLAHAAWQPAVAALERAHTGWLELIRDEAVDQHAAEAIMLIGEGLYLHAAMPGVWSRGTFEPSLDHLLDQVDRLRS